MQKRKNFIIYGIVMLFASYFLLLSAKPRPAIKSGKLDYIGRGREAVAGIGRKKLLEEIVADTGAAVRESGGELGLVRDDGMLWIDRELSLCLITLGILDGLDKGTFINVYDGKTKIGEAKVVQTFDLFSYVELFGKAPNEFTKNYYKVSIH
ncbi:MAG: hypothetical protein V3S04_00875 [Candidatus Omnitrophota bacterium]